MHRHTYPAHQFKSLVALSLCLSCDTAPTTLADCGQSMECLLPMTMDLAARDPTTLEAQLALLDGPVRHALVRAMFRQDRRADLTLLCGSFPEEAERRRCRAINERPHLWASYGSGQRVLAQQQPDDLPRTSSHCADADDPVSCLLLGSLEPWTELDSLAGHCAGAWHVPPEKLDGLSPQRLESECLFTAADHLIGFTNINSNRRPARPSELGDAAVALGLEACLQAGEFTRYCLGHLASTIVHRRTAKEGTDWRSVHDQVAALRRGVDQGETREGVETLAALVWNQALGQDELVRSELSSAQPFDGVDIPRAQLHTALVRTSWNRLPAGPTGVSLDSWSQLAVEVLGPPPVVDAPKAFSGCLFAQEQHLRLTSEDPELDLLLAVVNQAALARPEEVHTLEQAAAHERPELRAAAAFLRGRQKSTLLDPIGDIVDLRCPAVMELLAP